jgi:hypothetical protein
LDLVTTTGAAGLAAGFLAIAGAGALRTGVRTTAGFLPVFVPLDLDLDAGAGFFKAVEELADDLAFAGFFGVDFATGIPLFSRMAARNLLKGNRREVSKPRPGIDRNRLSAAGGRRTGRKWNNSIYKIRLCQ